MRLELSEDDARTLHAFLHDHLPELRMEVARTESREFRHELLKRQEVCERVLEMLEQERV